MKRINLLFASLVFLTPLAYADGSINLKDILLDKQVQTKLSELKHTAEAANIIKDKLSTADYQKIADQSQQLIQLIHEKNHINTNDYKVHTYIGLNKANSCYQYYNSYETDVIGKSCQQFPSKFATCDECNAYVKAVQSRPKDHILLSHWWKNESITSLVETFELKSGEPVYLGLEISPKK